MSEENQKVSFLGVYFDREFVFRLSKFAGIAAWVVLVLYFADWLLNFGIFAMQLGSGYFFEKGQLIYNLVGLVSPFLLRPIPGILYFFSLQAIAQVLLILVEIEGNTRRNDRNSQK